MTLKKPSNNNLLIIGNGFDLAHGLKSSYNHFIKHLVNSHCNDDILYNDLFNFYPIIKNYSDLKRYINDEMNKSYVKISNGFLNELLRDFVLNDWCDIEYKYFESLIKTKEKRFVKILNDQFNIVKGHLAEYLKSIQNNAAPLDSYQYLFDKVNFTSTLILNFNYTNVLNLYLADSKINLIQIHGDLNNNLNPMIFGYAANDQESRDLIDRNNNDYLRNIKKHCYKITKNETNLLNYLDGNENINVSILGHSCGISDKLILNQIFNHENIQSIRIFYFENYEHYFNTQVNIDRIMNDDVKFMKLLPFELSHRVPQFNDDSTKGEAFRNFINDNYKIVIPTIDSVKLVSRDKITY
jgi:hypothetical protein